VVLGRRGPAEAAFTLPELVGLAGLAGRGDVDVVVDSPVPCDPGTAKGRLLAELATRPRRAGARRIVLRFCTAPVRILGSGAVTGIEVETTRLVRQEGWVVAEGTGETEVLGTTLVVRSIGYRGRPVPGLPYDERSGTVPHRAGRVRPGVYVAGWVKRGPTGFIGTNKSCAEESVASFLDDLATGAITAPVARPRAIPGEIGLDGWRAIDAEERRRGVAQGRPRVKLDVAEQTTVARAARAPGRRALRLRP
jgi:ferredoxin--NADP+ reductase